MVKWIRSGVLATLGAMLVYLVHQFLGISGLVSFVFGFIFVSLMNLDG